VFLGLWKNIEMYRFAAYDGGEYEMYSNTANMLKQTTNLINALNKIKQNLSCKIVY